MKEKLKKIVRFILNPRLVFCFAVAWMFTNGWSYVLFAIGTRYEIGWMVAVSGAYLAFLWLPISPEKVVTFAISIVLLRWLFPKDTATLAVLKDLHQKAVDAMKKTKKKKPTEDNRDEHDPEQK